MCKSLASTAITRCLLMVAAFSLLNCLAAQSEAQDILTHYFRSRQNVAYSPTTPFDANRIARIHMGYTGFSFNCDREEDKRCSPYISWIQPPEKCREPGALASMKQQWAEVKQRIAWGNCCRICSRRDCKGCKPKRSVLTIASVSGSNPQTLELDASDDMQIKAIESGIYQTLGPLTKSNQHSKSLLMLPMLQPWTSAERQASSQVQLNDASFRMTRSSRDFNLK